MTPSDVLEDNRVYLVNQTYSVTKTGTMTILCGLPGPCDGGIVLEFYHSGAEIAVRRLSYFCPTIFKYHVRHNLICKREGMGITLSCKRFGWT